MRIQSLKAASFFVDHGVLVVTHPDYVTSETVLRLYPLAIPKAEGGPQNADQVADMLAGRLEPDTWSNNGGYGIVLRVNDGWLLVAQTLPMHQRVEEALDRIGAGDILPLPTHGQPDVGKPACGG